MKLSESKMIKLKGIKCDSKGCDYREDIVSADEYESYLNKPCPKCGSNLFTEKDFNAIKNLIRFEQLINTICDIPDGQKLELGLSMDGSGSVAIKDW